MSEKDTLNEQGTVEFKNFNYYFPGYDAPFLKDINLKIESGEFVGIIGPSSSGKTTLGLCMTGIYPHMLECVTEGGLRVCGLNVAEADPSEITTKIGVVFQDPDSQFCNLMVEEELAFGPENLRVKREEIEQRVEKYLRFVNLEGMNLCKISQLSGGQKQRLAIASVLAMEPEVLLLDQPTANVDPTGKEDIFETLYKINQETGKTLILIEHQIDELIRYMDKLIVLHNGSILYQGQPREILELHGQELENTHGLWVPEVSRAGAALKAHGVTPVSFPIVVEELAAQLEKNLPLLEQKPLKREAVSHEDQPPIITVEDVHFGYPSKANVLNGVNFVIKRGSIVSLMGENGSGKTTISKMLIGLLRPDSGKILIGDLDATKASLNKICKKVGYVFQYPDHQFVTDLVWDEVAYGLKQFPDMPAEEAKRIVEETIRITELEGLEQRHPFTLSMGEKRRLSIATMLVHKPEILILDEPSAGLDYKNCAHMMGVIRSLNESGVTIIMISHTTYLVARYSEHVLVMDNGRIVFDGKPEAMFRQLAQIHTRAIEKPEILKAIEFVESKIGRSLPDILIADEINAMLEEEMPHD